MGAGRQERQAVAEDKHCWQGEVQYMLTVIDELREATTAELYR